MASATATTVLIPGPPSTVVSAQATPIHPQPPHNLSSIKCLAITQLVIGVLTLLAGIAVVSGLWITHTGAGIWAGGWITVTGIVGVCLARNWMNTCLNGVYMAFSIISTCVSALAGLFFIVAVAFYANVGCREETDNNCSVMKVVGLAITAPLLILMVVEFFVSIIAAVFCCQNGCGNRTRGGFILQPAQQVVMVTAQPGNPAGAYPVAQYAQHGGQAMPPQYGVPQYGAQVPMQVPMQYGSGQVPPVYGAHPPPAGQPQYPPQGHFAYTDKPPEYRPQ